MLLGPSFDQLQQITHFCGQTGCVVSLYGQPATFFRSVEGEGGDNDQPPLGNRARKCKPISGALFGLGKKVKDSAVVPYAKPAGRLPIGDVGDFPVNLVFALAPQAHRVSGSRRLDLDDVSAHVAKKLAAKGTGQQLTHFHDAKAVQRACRELG